MNPLKVSVYGARGYTGLETCRLLLTHPHISSLELVSNDKVWKLHHDILSAARTTKEISYITREDFSARESMAEEVVFLACSATDAATMAPMLLEKGAKVIDLSGGHRLDKSDAKEFYGIDHSDDFYTTSENYGLVPYSMTSKKLVSNPGCFVSCVLMALLPLLKADLIETDSIVIDAKSGTSGAGRSPKTLTNLSELVDSVHPYKIGNHQHLPEIIRFAKVFTEKDIAPRFTTTLLPIKRGILSTLYLKTKSDLTLEKVQAAYDDVYKDYPFTTIHLLKGDAEDEHKLALRNVLHTNQTQVSLHLKGRELTVFSMIDNLMKGAAGQAVENLNLMFDLPLKTGIELS